MPDGVTGNTSDFGSEESRFEPWSGNQVNYNPLFNNKLTAGFLLGDGLGDAIWGKLTTDS